MIRCPACGHQIQEWWTFTATLPEEARDVVESAIEELRREDLHLHGERRIQMGRALEALAASYLAGAHDAADALKRYRGTGERTDEHA